MSSQAITLADAIAAQLNSASAAELFSERFDKRFEARRVFIVPQELSYYDEIRVVVVPILLEREIVSRGTDQQTYTVSIGVRKRLGSLSDMDEQVAANIAVVEAIGDYLRDNALEAIETATYIGATLILFDPEAMNETRIATSVIDVQYVIGG